MKTPLSSAIIWLLILSTLTLIIHTCIHWEAVYAKTIFATTTTKPPMKGMTINAWSAEAYNSSNFDQSIANLADIEANWVTFTVFWFMENSSDTQMHPRPDLYSASDSSLVHAIQKAHELEMNVSLKPMIDVVDGTWRGEIQPTNWTIWFNNYRSFINHYADLAEANDVELFVVGTELKTSQPYEQEWRHVISEVRVHFSGNITYAANWDSYGTSHVKFWDALDYVGVDAYFPLTNSYNPTVEQLKNAWSSCTASGWRGRNWVNELYLVYTQTSKKIVFTEIGYCSQNGTNTQPWNWNLSPTVDLQEQADCYQAALEVFRDKAWFTGWFWWSWETDPNAGGENDRHYTPQNKLAQNILYQYYYEAPPDIAVINVTLSKTVVGQGYSTTINVTAENQGNYAETFNVTVYYNETNPIAIQTVNLTSGYSTTITFTWNTTGVAKGIYTISATATPLPGETNTTDNTYTDGTVRVGMAGDVVEPFGEVDIFDIAHVAKGYEAKLITDPQDPRYGQYWHMGEPCINCPHDPNTDIDGNGEIDIFDVSYAAKNYEK